MNVLTLPGELETSPCLPEVKGYNQECVLEVEHWTDRLFSFKTTRSQSLRFESGQFVMIGLLVAGKPLVRAYSIVSATYDDHLEFLSIKVPDGPLTSRLQHIREGDYVLVGRKPTGTLLLSNLRPGKRLYLLATGTGFAPFGSIIRDPEVYERFEHVILVYGCRRIAELAFGTRAVVEVRNSEHLREIASEKLLLLTTVTREPYVRQARVTTLVQSGQVTRDLGLPDLDPTNDRVMICGSAEMLRDLRSLLAARGFGEGSNSEPGDFVIERAFVER
ncbi:MAG: ferredoxin--NADP reductase [Hyphomicrobiaceae bacterium]|nr:MAG: ferredoxin--NADP reductase [Hyphomicrobiaceae bacterium]